MGYMAETYGFYSHWHAGLRNTSSLRYHQTCARRAQSAACRHNCSGDDVGDPANPDYSSASESHLDLRMAFYSNMQYG